ncbi:asparagine synthase-related protein [Desulfobacula phenolica]|uniref:asparagine synthase (glutamine-hydrolyzing) n=1 Tax=Desulfobacula phenolica TaxID=90732 RepID=A0A1H2DTX1_9BACT|nr:asparagine synthase-related protein [Desulfobacula phenolica]SDT86315.1 Asparagine synthase [Desulfobacula phenolica]
MSKIIYVYTRNNSFRLKDKDRLLKICKELEPENIASKIHHKASVNDHIAFAIMNYTTSLIKKGNSVLLGCLYDQCESWDEPLTDFMDGSYALFRDNEDCLEVVTDAVASRTIWYYFDENCFVASTSQRAILMFIGSFHFDERVIPWLLSTGSLGPELSWDKRLKRLPADSSVLLEKKKWSISMKQAPINFAEYSRSDNEHKKKMEDAIDKTMECFKHMNFEKWALPLSGGYDSRAILCFLVNKGYVPENFTTITWGLEQSIKEKKNDAKVAKDIANTLGVTHKYYYTNVSDEPIKKIIDRFLLCGEGRIDHLSGYMDGMKLWRDLFDDGRVGIIRGDEGFGWSPVSSALMVRYSIGCALCSDYSNLVNVIERFGLSNQVFPAELKQKNESLSTWRDRLYHAYRIPTVLAALSDLKLSYAEQISPLLSRSILNRVREMPDRLRTDKALFKKIVDYITPKIPYANKGANASVQDILKKGPVIELIRDTLRCDYSRTLFGSEFLNYIEKNISFEGSSNKKNSVSIKQFIKKLIPKFIKNWLKNNELVLPTIDPNKLAFRVYIVIRMHQILSKDCNRIKSY